MNNKYVFVLVMLVSILLASVGLTTIYVNKAQPKMTTKEEDDIRIVTSFYPMYIATKNIVGDADGVILENLSEPQTGCLHDFQLTPEDMKRLSYADIFVINGGGIEGFMSEVAAAYPELEIVEACQDVVLLGDDAEEHNHDEVEHDEADHEGHEEADHEEHDEEGHENHGEEGHNHGDENAHAWLSVESYRTMVDTIASRIAALDSRNAQIYLSNAKAYDDKLVALQKQQEEVIKLAHGQKVIIFHEAYEYVAEDYGLDIAYVMDLDEERQVSAGEVADVVSAVSDNKVKVILAEALYGKNMGDTVSNECDVGVVYIDTLNRGNYEADSYIEGMSKNIDILKNVFSD